MTTKIRYVLLLAMASIVIIACSKDQLDSDALICEEPIIYEDVRNIITASCGYVDCHNGFSSLANYNNFAGLESQLSNGSFSNRSLITRDMPPTYATGPLSLTEEEIDLLKCWEQNGFSEF